MSNTVRQYGWVRSLLEGTLLIPTDTVGSRWRCDTTNCHSLCSRTVQDPRISPDPKPWGRVSSDECMSVWQEDRTILTDPWTRLIQHSDLSSGHESRPGYQLSHGWNLVEGHSFPRRGKPFLTRTHPKDVYSLVTYPRGGTEVDKYGTSSGFGSVSLTWSLFTSTNFTD